MARHTTFRFRLDPTVEQAGALARHAGASRFAYNQCLRLHRQARRDRARDGAVVVPWTGFDFINAFNAWKKTSDAGRVFAAAADGATEVVTTGLAWRSEVCQQVFEEAAVDLGKALSAWSESRRGKRAGRRVGYPRSKKKGRCVPSFRLRNKHPKGGRPAVRVGDGGHPRSVTLPGIGTVRVFDDTRPLRRLLATGRGKVLFATVSQRAGRWLVSLNVDAADLHASAQHGGPGGRWVGVDRGLHAFAVAATADGREVARVDAAGTIVSNGTMTNESSIVSNGGMLTPLTSGMARQRRLARAVTRKTRGSANRRKAAAALGRHHHRVANTRKHFLHQVSNELVKTHTRLVIEDLNVAGMLGNRRLARAISDAGWAEFARLLAYKQAWRHGQLVPADRWFPSSKTCSGCGTVRPVLGLGERTYHCPACGLTIDRDLNAAINLAAWAEQHHRADARAGDREAPGPVTNAYRQDRADRHPRDGETGLDDVGTRDPAATTA